LQDSEDDKFRIFRYRFRYKIRPARHRPPEAEARILTEGENRFREGRWG